MQRIQLNIMVIRLCFLLVVVGTRPASSGRPQGVGCNADYGFYNTSFAVDTAWDDFPTAVKEHLATCGVDQTQWNGPADCISCWSGLSKAKQDANLVTGSSAACHDSAMTTLYGLSCTTKPASSDCDVSLGVLKASRPAIMKPWSQLSADLKTAAATCGVSQKTWDGPSECRSCFADLSPAKKQAVLSMDTDAECWDQSLFRNYGINCTKLIHDMPNLTKRYAVYSNVSLASMQRKFQFFHRKIVTTPSLLSFGQMQLVSLALIGLLLIFFTKGFSKVPLGKASKDPQSAAMFNDGSDEELDSLLRVEDTPLE